MSHECNAYGLAFRQIQGMAQGTQDFRQVYGLCLCVTARHDSHWYSPNSCLIGRMTISQK